MTKKNIFRFYESIYAFVLILFTPTVVDALRLCDPASAYFEYQFAVCLFYAFLLVFSILGLILAFYPKTDKPFEFLPNAFRCGVWAFFYFCLLWYTKFTYVFGQSLKLHPFFSINVALIFLIGLMLSDVFFFFWEVIYSDYYPNPYSTFKRPNLKGGRHDKLETIQL